MTQERGAKRPSWSLSAQNYTVAYGQAQFMSETGKPAASGWFGPLAPLAPIAPKEVAGRAFDFPSGYNITARPRSFEPITVEDLRKLAETYDLLRIVIETRKDQIERLPWSLRVKPGKTGPGAARLDELTNFFERPDREHDFSVWLRMLLEDLFVLDSPTLWRQRRRNGELYALHPLDGATIKRVIDDWGRTPQPFEEDGALVYPVAYQQVLKGYPAIDYSTRDLIYAPRNLRPGRVYGLSPVEQIVMTVCTALKRQTFTLTHFTEGNIPESLIGVPDNWTPDQIKNFQDYWDAYFTGDLAARRRAKFVPGGVAKTFIQTKEPELKGVFDEWLARIVCCAFSVSPQAFVAQVNRSTGETHKEMAEEEGLRPILNWVKRLVDRVLVEDFGERDVEFVFGQDERIDPGEQAQILTAYVNAGILTRNEARAKLGQAPSEDAAANELTVTTGAGATPLVAAPAHDVAKAYDPKELRDWQGRWTTGGNAAPEHPTSERKTSGGVQVAADDLGAMEFHAFMATAAALAAAGNAARNLLDGYISHSKPPPTGPSSKPRKKKGEPPAPAVPQASAAAAGAPNPEENGRERDEPKDETPRKPSYEIGASDGGPGKWVKETIKPKYAAYQEKATGAPRGLAYAVPDPEAPSGFTKFDSYDPETKTLIDAKRWAGWPIEKDLPIEQNFSARSVREQARKEFRAANGTKIIWRVASAEKAAQVRDILDESGFTEIAIEVFGP
jgi:HK97 family phage portal protein